MKHNIKLNSRIRYILIYIIQNYFIQFLNVVYTIISVKYLSLRDYGRFNLAKSISNIFEYTHLGTRFTIDRKIPECDEFHKNIIFSISFYSNLISSILVLIVIFFLGYDIYYLVFCFTSIIFANINLCRIFFRANNKTKYFIKLTFLLNLTSISSQILGLIFFGLWGALILSLINNVLYFGYLLSQKLKLLGIRSIKKWYFFYTIDKGIILFLNALLSYLASSADRVIVNYFGGEEKVGIYSLIFLFYSFMMMVPNSIGEMMYPEFIKRKNNYKSLNNYIYKTTILFSATIILLYIIVIILISPTINIFFKQYVDIIHPMKLSCIAIFPNIFIPILYYYLFSQDKTKLILYSNFISIIIYWVFLLLALNNNYNNNFLALSKFIYSIFYCFLLFIFYVKTKTQNELSYFNQSSS